MDIVYYALAVSPKGLFDHHCRQLVASAESLRAHNRRIPVRLYHYGPLPADLGRRLAALDVEALAAGSYEAALRRHLEAGVETLGTYRFLQKWLCLEELLRDRPSHLMYIDCDTYFFTDVAAIFDRHRQADFASREEPFTSHSHLGYDAKYVDEQKLRAICEAEDAAPLAVFNDGVFLMNRRTAQFLSDNLAAVCQYLLRFTMWMNENPDERPLPEETRAALAAEGPRLAARLSPLHYPASNHWIRDQLSLLLTLGKLPNVRQTLFPRHEILQSMEFLLPGPDRPLACHYYSRNTERFFQWIQERGEAEAARKNLTTNSANENPDSVEAAGPRQT